MECLAFARLFLNQPNLSYGDIPSYAVVRVPISKSDGHGVWAENLRLVQSSVEANDGEDVDEEAQGARDPDGPGQVPDRVSHLLDYEVEVVPACMHEEPGY